MGRSLPETLLLWILETTLLTVPVCLVLILLYRRAVNRAMRVSTSGVDDPLPTGTPSRVNRDSPVSSSFERRARLRLIVIYSLAGAGAAAFWTWLYLQSTGIEFNAVRGFTIWFKYCWPIPLTLIILVALSWRRAFQLLAGYVLAGVLGVIVISILPHLFSSDREMFPLSNAKWFLAALVLEVSVGALLVAAVASRRIRAVSALALAALLIFVVGAWAATEVFVQLFDIAGFQKLLLSIGVRWWFLLLSLPVGYLCWRVLTLLDAGYLRKMFSNVQLVIDSVWILITCEVSTQLGSRAWLGLAGFPIYRVLVQLGLMAWRVPSDSGQRLLLLRVFGFRRRTEKLFDSVAERWRFRGSVAMIAGTDLATHTIDPNDTLAFLSGRFQSRFIGGSRDLGQRLKQTDDRRDPDGRFRVDQYFCHADTWSGTLTALAGRSDAILMDLRGFSEHNSGCTFELRQLAAQQRIPQTIFVVDAATDTNLLESTIRAAAPQSPSLPLLHLEMVDKGSAGAGERVYRSLSRM